MPRIIVNRTERLINIDSFMLIPTVPIEVPEHVASNPYIVQLIANGELETMNEMPPPQEQAKELDPVREPVTTGAVEHPEAPGEKEHHPKKQQHLLKRNVEEDK